MLHSVDLFLNVLLEISPVALLKLGEFPVTTTNDFAALGRPARAFEIPFPSVSCGIIVCQLLAGRYIAHRNCSMKVWQRTDIRIIGVVHEPKRRRILEILGAHFMFIINFIAPSLLTLC